MTQNSNIKADLYFPEKGKSMAGHFQVAGSAIIEKEGKVLITKRVSGRWCGDVWEFVSGRLEQGEDMITALQREVMEEVGLIIEVLYPIYVAHFYRGETKSENEVIMVTYVCRYISGTVQLKTDEQSEYRWVTSDELIKYESLMNIMSDEVNKYREIKHGIV